MSFFLPTARHPKRPALARRRRFRRVGIVLLALASVLLVRAALLPAQQAARDEAAGMFRGTLSDPDIDESSGLAKSNRHPGHFWTHNDSGDSARLFAFDGNGTATGRAQLVGVRAVDFEDIASYVQDGVPRLVFADIGDNRSTRQVVSLYFFDEPDPRQQSVITDYQRLELRYPDGPRDCEAVAVDVEAGTVTLVSKTFLPRAAVYTTPLPPRGQRGGREMLEPRVLERAGPLPLPLVTGMDRDDATGDILLVTYFQLYRFPASTPAKPWWEQTPTASDLPRFRQIEAVAVDHDGRVLVTSEGKPAPWGQVNEERPNPANPEPPTP